MSGDANESKNLPSLVSWLESYLPFRIPRMPLPQTAKNIDKAFAQIITGGAENVAARLAANTEKVKALGEARATYIERGSELLTSGGSELDNRALSYVLENARLEQINRERIVELAAEAITNDMPNEDAAAEIETDWLKVFARFSSEKSSEEIRSLWAKILVGEIKAPGSTSLRTLSQIATFDKADAEMAHSILNYAINNDFVFTGGYATGSKGRGMPYRIGLKGVELGLLYPSSSISWPSNKLHLHFVSHERAAIFSFGDLEQRGFGAAIFFKFWVNRCWNEPLSAIKGLQRS